MPRILITGANGQVGQELQDLAKAFPDFQLVFTDMAELDITHADAINTFFSQTPLDYCINCAAYTAVDKAETATDLAQMVNRDGAQNIARACHQYKVRLIHFSTDYIYHNSLNRPLLETDPTEPKGVYARTKLEGEVAVRTECPEALILRTSWVYSSFGHNFVKTMLRLGKEGKELRIVDDQIGAPTYARDLARTCLQIIQNTENEKQKWHSGVFNYSNEGVCSWYDFGLAIFELTGIPCDPRPIESKDYPTPAKRPFYSALNKSKFKSVFKIDIPYWRHSLIHCLKRLGEINENGL